MNKMTPKRRIVLITGMSGAGLSTALKTFEDMGYEAVDNLRLSLVPALLEEDKAAVSEDLREVYGEAKGTGFDVKIIRKIVSLRKIEVEKRREQEELLDLYKSALGMKD